MSAQFLLRSLPAVVPLTMLLVACSRSSPQAGPAASPSEVAATASVAAPPASAHGAPSAATNEPAAAPAPTIVTFSGMCDASGAVELSDRVFAVADDEDNIIRTYDAERGGAPLATYDLSPSLHLPVKPPKPGKPPKPNAKPKRAPETDLEAAARIGDLAFWLTSHGRNSSAKLKQERLRFFATTLPKDGAPLQVSGVPYEHLLDDLLTDPRLTRFGLAEAATRAPKEAGGLNLEGMTARKEGGLWLGFRNPVPDGKALVLALLNPEEVMRGARAKLGDPLLLELGGLGVRSLSSWRERYLIAAGHFAHGAVSQLFAWDGKTAPRPVKSMDFREFNPEGFFTPDGREQIMVLSDDGGVPIDGVECKKLKDPAAKTFRGAWLPRPQ